MEKYEPDNGSGQEAARTGGSIQGEGDYQAARNYRHEVETFLEHADVTKAAREAAPRNRKEERELQQAEDAGRSRAKGRLMPDRRRTSVSLGALRDAVRQRPLVAVVMGGVLGYLIGRIGQRG